MIEQEILLQNPFPGLRPFSIEESEVFFGRDGQSDQVLTKLSAARFVAVVGTSGSGKSSMVAAGLLPALFSGHLPSAGSSWRVASFRPGSSPIRNLAEALSAPEVCGVKDEKVAGERLENIERTLRRSSLGLLEVVSQSKLAPGENLLILADQFEELFRFRKKSTAEHPADEAAAFVKLLLEAKQANKPTKEKLPIYVVLTMRSDYLGDCAHFWGLPEAINEGQFLIPRMTDDNRREAITGPVIIGGGEIAPRLVNRLLNDAGDDPAQLPILQHALMRTWDYWKHEGHARGAIDISHYETIGGMADALSRHADEAFLDLSPELQNVAAKVFKALTEKEADSREGRRPATISEIAVAAGASEEQVRIVVETFRREGRSFLMPGPRTKLGSDTLIDISHESLIRGWWRLRAWVDEEAEAARQYVRLADKAALFPKEEDYLREPALSTGLKWLQDNRPTKAWGERYHLGFDKTIEYLELSEANRKAEIDLKEKQQKEEIERDLRHAQALAAGEKRRVKLRNWSLVILSLLLLGMFGLTAFAFQQKARAEGALQSVALERDNATRAEATAKEQKLFAEHATAAAERATRRAEEERDNARKAREETAKQRDLAEHQRAEAVKQAKIAQAATIEADRQKSVAVDALAKQEMALVAADLAKKEAVDAKKDAERKRDEADELLRTVTEIDRSAPYFGGIMRGHQSGISNVWFAGASDRVVTQSADGSAKKWFPAMGLVDLPNLPYLADRVTTPVLYNKNASVALLTKYPGHEGTVIWDIPGRKELARVPWTVNGPENTVFSPNGELIMHRDRPADPLSIIKARTGQQLVTIPDIGPLRLTAVSADSSLLVDVDGSAATVMNLETRAPLARLEGHLDAITSVAFSRDKKFLVTGSEDGTAKVWNIGTGFALALSGHGGTVNSVSMSDDDRYIVTTSGNNAYLWEAKSPASWSELTESSPARLQGHTDIVTGAAFSPDGKWVVTISQDRTAQLWDAKVSDGLSSAAGPPPPAVSVAVFRGHIKPVTSVDVSPDSKYMVTGSEDRTARVWDLHDFGVFKVATAQLAATAPEYGGKCPANVEVNGKISVTGRSGKVKYKFVRSDGSESLPQLLTFDGPGVKEVTDTREVFGKGVSRSNRPIPVEGWIEVEILEPTPMKSNRADFVVKCGEDDLRFMQRRKLSASELQQIIPDATEAHRALYLPHLQMAIDEFGINTALRQAAFLAEVAQQTANLSGLVEPGSDSLLEKRYGSRKDFGNFQPGDGARFKGRGAFFLTGRAQYQAIGAQLGVDLLADPDKAAAPEVAFRTAALYWQKMGLNERADKELLPEIHRRIYGGNFMLDKVQVYYDRAKRALSPE